MEKSSRPGKLTASDMKISPLAPDRFPRFEEISGVRFSTAAAGLKYSGRSDLMLAVFDSDAAAAGVFTNSKTAAAAVDVCRKRLENNKARALIVNSGNANAFTGKQGRAHCLLICETVARVLGCDADDVFIASTGVIGEPLPIEKILQSIPGLASDSGSDWIDAARAILTTDTFAKGSTLTSSIGDREIRISGFAKGSGMIAPDMATMLAFVFTDADISAAVLQSLLEEANHDSFNAITVDSDTSTNDTCLLFATGAAGNAPVADIKDRNLSAFKSDLKRLMIDLAKQVVRDGEGATKLIEINVFGAENDSSARVIAKSIGNSPLVKTAIAGEDANWGRIVMAVGKSGEKADRDKLNISIGDTLITADGQVAEGYDEKRVAAHLGQKEIEIHVDIGIGCGRSRIWTCDLTHGYIAINADYRS